MRALLFSTKGFSEDMYASLAYDGLLAKFWSIFAIYNRLFQIQCRAQVAKLNTKVKVRRGCLAGGPSTSIYA